RTWQKARAEQRPPSDVRGQAQTDQETQREKKPAERNQQGRQTSARAIGSDPVVHQGGGVDAHERDEGAEVQHLRAKLVGERQPSSERDAPAEENVVARNVVPGSDGAEEPAG